MDKDTKIVDAAMVMDIATLDTIDPGWRDLPLSVEETAEILGIQLTSVMILVPRTNGGDTWDLGVVVDYAQARPKWHKDDELAVTDDELAGLIDDPNAFLLALRRHPDPASVVFTSSLLRHWGKDKSRLTSDVIPRFPAAYKTDFRHAGGGRYQQWILNGLDLLAWVQEYTAPEFGKSRDQVRDLYRVIVKNVAAYKRKPTKLSGALGLIKAWRTFDALLAYEVPDETDTAVLPVSARRLRNYISNSADLLGRSDPAWALPPLDIEFVGPDKFYLVDISGWPCVLSRHGYTSRLIAGRDVEGDNISITPGGDIIARPHGYTEKPEAYTPGSWRS